MEQARADAGLSVARERRRVAVALEVAAQIRRVPSSTVVRDDRSALEK
jgi:hypothetical protein